MLSKILLVTILILLTWGSVKSSKNNEHLNAQFVELTADNELIKQQILINHGLLQKQSNAMKKDENLSDLSKSMLKKITKIEKNLSDVASTKALTEKLNNSIKKQTASLLENKKTISQIKKSIHEITFFVKNHTSSHASLNISKGTTFHAPKKHLYSKKGVKNTKIIKAKASSDSASLNRLFFELYKTKKSHNKRKMKEALSQLEKLKTEVWKSRNHKNISKDLVMSILSSIDITNNKWNNKEINYDLENIEQKLNRLICKPGVCK